MHSWRFRPPTDRLGAIERNSVVRFFRIVEPIGLLIAIIAIGVTLWQVQVDLEERDEARNVNVQILHALAWLTLENARGRGYNAGAAEALNTLVRADFRDFVGINLANTYLADTNLGEVNLTDAHLRRANLREAFLSGANLSGADLSEANLTMAFLEGADLSEADLSEANLSNAYLVDAVVSAQQLNSACADPSGPPVGMENRGPLKPCRGM